MGISPLGFQNKHDCTKLKRLIKDLGIEINGVIPEDVLVHDLKTLPKAWFNLVPYPEFELITAQYLQEKFGTHYVDSTPTGMVKTARCIRTIQ